VEVIEMKRSLSIAFALMFCASLAFGQGAGGSIGLFSDLQGTDCNLWDVVPGLGTYYVVHTGHQGATAAQFMARKPACLLATYLSDSAVHPVTIGNSQTGVAVNYGFCYYPPTLVLTINFFCQGLTGQCCTYRVSPDPRVPSGQIEVADCAFNIWYAAGNCAVVNPNASCPCWATPAEKTTWGRVKAQYQ
jgi:hypothetical protein